MDDKKYKVDFLIEKREFDRRKHMFRTSKVLCDSPVTIYMDYLIKTKSFTRQTDATKYNNQAKRYNKRLDLSEFEDQLKHLDKQKMRQKLDEYIVQSCTKTHQVENQFGPHGHISFQPEVICEFFQIQADSGIQEEMDYIRQQSTTRWLPVFQDYLRRMLADQKIKGIASKRFAIFYLVKTGNEIKMRLGVERSDSHANEIVLYMQMYVEMAYALITWAERVLPGELFKTYVEFYQEYLATLMCSTKEIAVAALLLESPKKAMQYYGSMLLFSGYQEFESISEQIFVTVDQLVIPDEIISAKRDLECWRNNRGINSSTFKKLDKNRMSIVKEFINSGMGKMLRLSDSSVLDIISAYNFLFVGKDELKFKNRSNADKGYKTYCVQKYVFNILEFEQEARNRDLKMVEEYRKLGLEKKIEPSEEYFSAMKVFLIYKECVRRCQHGGYELQYIIEAIRLSTIKSIAYSILRYNAIETINANTDFLSPCISALYDLYHYGELRPIKDVLE